MSFSPSAPSGATVPPPLSKTPFHGGSIDMPTSKVELSIKCADLENRDYTSKSDPLCVVYLSMGSDGKGSQRWYEYGRTEMIKDTLNPKWQKTFTISYSFEQRQPVKFEIYDWDFQSKRLEDQDFLGVCETSMGQIVSSQGRQFVSTLKHSSNSLIGQKKVPKIFVTAEELEESREEIKFQFKAENLDKKDFFGKSDPFFVISKESTNGQWTVVYRSEVIMKTLNPNWKQFSITMLKLCNANPDRRLKFEVFDWNNDGSEDFMGSFIQSFAALREQMGSFDLINDKKKQKKGSKYVNSGKMTVQKCDVYAKPSFIDYLQSGTSMNFSVAVDFTASNGKPSDPRSLHYLNPQTMENEYTAAIRSVGEIVQDYDSDKMFPALGFGAKIPPNYQVNHEFFLTLNPQNPFCAGVDGLLNAYRTSLQQVQLYGPTNFTPVINHVANFARVYYEDGKQYFVLLILTDGVITDMESTKRAIIAASDLPMSIIIVGVGDAEFDAMDELDCDGKLLRSGSLQASRDIVQFVELRRFLTKNSWGQTTWSKEALAKDVLAEVPDQLVSWMVKRGFKPEILQ